MRIWPSRPLRVFLIHNLMTTNPRMLELQGIAVSPGVAIGKAIVFDREGYSIARCLISRAETQKEWDRLVDAVGRAHHVLGQRGKQTTDTWGSDLGGIFSAQQQLLLDPHVRSEMEHLIKDNLYACRVCGERSVCQVCRCVSQSEFIVLGRASRRRPGRRTNAP